MSRLHVASFGLFAIILLLGCVGNQSANKEAGGTVAAHATPEAAFQGLKQAADKQEWATAARYMVPESQRNLAFALMLKASFSTFDDQAKETSLNELLTKHGVNMDDGSEDEPVGDLEQEIEMAFKAVQDVPALIGQLAEWMNRHSDGGKDNRFLQLGQLGSVKIDGDRATGFVQTDRGEMPIAFRKSAGGWLVSLSQ